MHYSMKYVLAAVAMAALTACATAASGGDETSADRVYVVVENDARFDLEVSVIGRGQDLRIGRVQIGEQRRLRVPASFLGDPPYGFAVRLVPRVGQDSYMTPQLNVPERQNVYIEASPTLQSSRYTVR